MSGEENPKPVNIDPQCIQDALRMYFQPIKKDDPELDFYTMYKRETVEYDAEYMQKYNDDLSTTLIFAGLFSAVSTAFIIDAQSKLEPGTAERSEAYLRAILLSLNRSISPDENPTAPPAWKSPPQEIIASLSLLYASLLISLLAAFVAMLGKQWCNRYLRHTGGSVIERCRDRQRKFDGLQKWPFRPFIESLPIMLQVALFLLTCGLSRYMWSVNASVACVVISFTVLCFVFYIGVVFAGTRSYECPFQTPASVALRRPEESGAGNARHRTVTPCYKRFGNAIQTMDQGLRRFTRWVAPSTSTEGGDHELGVLHGGQGLQVPEQDPPAPTAGVDHEPVALPNGQGLLVPAGNTKAIRRRNMDNAGCICWILRNLTDPEALDAAIRLAGTIRWFDGDSDHYPQFDVIVSAFETCFDSAGQLYPGMIDRAYFSARAIVQINSWAGIRLPEHASKYPIPVSIFSSTPFSFTDLDLDDVVAVLRDECPTPALLSLFPDDRATLAHSLWVSNLHVDLACAGWNQILSEFWRYFGVATTNHRPMISNILVMWNLRLGGDVEEDTLWAVDKSVFLEATLLSLSQKVVKVIEDADENHFTTLFELFLFLAMWKGRPVSLTPMAYQWCSAISKAAGQFGLDGTDSDSLICDRLRYPGRYPGSSLDFRIPLEIAFRLFGLANGKVDLTHTSHHNKIFEVAFSSDNDDIIADAACAWIIGRSKPNDSCAGKFSKRVENLSDFSPRLRQVAICALGENGTTELDRSGLDVVRLMNRVEACVDDFLDERPWAMLLMDVIRSPVSEHLSPHHWRLLDELQSKGKVFGFKMRDVEVMRSLEGAGDWEKLEIWIAILWFSLTLDEATPELVEEIGEVTLRLISSQPSALHKFENLPERVGPVSVWTRLKEVLGQAQAQQPPQWAPGEAVPLPPAGGYTFSDYATSQCTGG